MKSKPNEIVALLVTFCNAQMGEDILGEILDDSAEDNLSPEKKKVLEDLGLNRDWKKDFENMQKEDGLVSAAIEKIEKHYGSLADEDNANNEPNAPLDNNTKEWLENLDLEDEDC